MRTSIVEYCAKIGTHPLLVQGAGGNISWKDSDVLWIKASGTWLADAADQDIFVPVDFLHLRNALEDKTFTVTPQVKGNSTLRPSIETLLHALMPQPVVVHIHTVDVLAHLVRSDFPATLTAQLGQEVKWISIEYYQPGAPLAEALSHALAEQLDADVVLLRNHGVIIGGQSVAEVDHRLSVLLEALSTLPRHPIATPIPTHPIRLPNGQTYAPIAEARLHAFALDPQLFARLREAWALYPDHVVFLGPHAHCFPNASAFQSASLDIPHPELVFIEQLGVFTLPTFGMSKQAQLGCYYEVLTRLSDDCDVHPLTDDQIRALVHCDAGRYRREAAK